MARHAYLGLIAGALLVITRTIQFTPPDKVRVETTDVGQLVGDAPRQEFSNQLSNPQAVQLRATLRLYPDPELPVRDTDPDVDAQGRLLSQPVVTTILGMNATMDQSIRLEDGALEVDLTIHATPRTQKARKGLPPLVVETELTVESRRRPWITGRTQKRVHFYSEGFLHNLEDGHRVVFAVDQHLFSLDLEAHRPTAGTLAAQP